MTKDKIEEYLAMKHRIEQLRNRILLDSGFEAETAKRLLERLLEKLARFEKANNISQSNSEAENKQRNTFVYHEKEFKGDSRTEEQLMKDLGVIYAIFGRIYKTSFNYHNYIIHFLRLCENQDASFCRVYANIYEDDILIAKEITIGFWPYHKNDTICGDMETASYYSDSFLKYDNGSSVLYQHLVSGLKDIWNFYFGLIPLRIESTTHSVETLLTKEERDEIVHRVGEKIWKKKSNVPQYLKKNMFFYVRASYTSLEEFLEESGIIYRVKEDGVYIFCNDSGTYLKLISIEETYSGYSLWLSTI